MAKQDPTVETETLRKESSIIESAGTPQSISRWVVDHKLEAILLLLLGGVLLFFYGLRESYGIGRNQSTLEWMWLVCGDARFDYFHGRLIPLIILGLVAYRWPTLKAEPKGSELWGLGILVCGLMFYILAERVLQARIAAGSIPFVAFGLIAY